MLKYNTNKAPHRRHVFVSPDLRFLVWRSPDGTDTKSIFMLNVKSIETGLATPELQNTSRAAATEANSLAVFGALRNVSLEVRFAREGGGAAAYQSVVITSRSSHVGASDA